jgi:hypothetical protein
MALSCLIRLASDYFIILTLSPTLILQPPLERFCASVKSENVEEICLRTVYY